MILGGGDGGLLKELLELPKGQAPSFVTMVDIDGMVMDACAEFMPNVCGKYLKRVHWDGDNYKVINGCAIQFMKDCLVCFIKLQRGTLYNTQCLKITQNVTFENFNFPI